MKRTISFLVVFLFALFVKAQNYKDISAEVLTQQYKKAKTDLDKRMTNEKFAAKPEAYILKTAIYANLAMDSASGVGTPAQLLSEAEAAFAKYKEMDGPDYKLIDELEYKEGAVGLYRVLYAKAIDDLQDKKWEQSYQYFKRLIDVSDLLRDKKIITAPIDTTVVLYAGYTAQNSSHRDDAAKYYAKFADAGVGGADNDFVYRFLVMYNFEDHHMDAFEKYKKMGKELYPNNEFFGYDKVDFAAGLAEGFTEKIKALEEVLKTDPNNYKALVSIAQFISDTLHPGEGGVPPANADELEAKMINSLSKAATLPESDETVYLVWGDHFIDKSDKLNDERAKFGEEMRARTKPGAQPSKADLQKRDELDAKYAEAFYKAAEPYEKAAAILAAKGDLTARDKQQYRKVAGYLGDIYNLKKARATQAKATADVAKYTAEAKKWNDLYDTLR